MHDHISGVVAMCMIIYLGVVAMCMIIYLSGTLILPVLGEPFFNSRPHPLPTPKYIKHTYISAQTHISSFLAT